MSDADHMDLERHIATALHAPLGHAASARARDAIMARVRRSVASDGMPVRRPRPFGHRTARHSLIGVALAAGIGSITTLSTLLPGAPALGRGASGSAVVASAVIGDSVVATLRDTLRLVRLIFDEPRASEVAVIGDFNGWRAAGTPMQRQGADGALRWSVTLALRDGDHRYAFVVDGTRWVADRAGRATRADAGRLYSLLRVTRDGAAAN